MGQKFTVEARSSLPPARAEWEVDLGDDPKQTMIYTNLGYDLIAAAMAKLGVEMSRFVLGEQDESQFNAKMAPVFEALKSTVV